MLKRTYSRPDQFGRTHSVATAVIFKNARGAWTSTVSFHGGPMGRTHGCTETRDLKVEKSRVAGVMRRAKFKAVTKWEETT